MAASQDMVIRLPEWVRAVAERAGQTRAGVEERMEFAIWLAEENVRRGTGGPFGAAVFEMETGRLVAPGVNVTVPERCSFAHAEILALSIAQQALGTHDLGRPGFPAFELVSSTEPCAMCMGAVPWSGVRRLVCGARGEDACGVGFDEGAKPPAWAQELERRGIAVLRDVRREEAAAVLRRYAAGGGPIYNSRLTPG